MILAMTACGSSSESSSDNNSSAAQAEANTTPAEAEPEELPEEPEVEEDLPGNIGSMTEAFYSQFTNGNMYMAYEFEEEGTVYKMETATLDGKTWSRSNYGGMESTVIDDDEYMYVIDDESKMVYKMQSYSEDVVNMLNEEEMAMCQMTTGTRTIDGKEYFTEEWADDEGSTIMCFDGGTLAYEIGIWEGEETLIKILSYSANVDSSLFELPDGYEVMDFN